MTFLTLVRTELKRLTATPMAKLALAALMLVPVLYAGLYLWGNDDPYGNLDQVPVALVVADEGATQDGETVNYGDQVRDQLVEDAEMDWHVTTSQEAADGIRSPLGSVSTRTTVLTAASAASTAGPTSRR